MVLDPIPQSLPVHFFGSRPQPPTSRAGWFSVSESMSGSIAISMNVSVSVAASYVVVAVSLYTSSARAASLFV